jgi:hypothetical protein
MTDERDFFCIFVHGCPLRSVVAWLEEVAGPLTLRAAPWEHVFLYKCSHGKVLVNLIPEDDELSVWFSRDGRWQELWASLKECA